MPVENPAIQVCFHFVFPRRMQFSLTGHQGAGCRIPGGGSCSWVHWVLREVQGGQALAEKLGSWCRWDSFVRPKVPSENPGSISSSSCLNLFHHCFPVMSTLHSEANGAQLTAGLALRAVWGVIVYFLQDAVTAALKKKRRKRKETQPRHCKAAPAVVS